MSFDSTRYLRCSKSFNLDIADINENLTTLWIDATYKAVDYGMNVSQLLECLAWREFWAGPINGTDDGDADELLVGQKRRLKAICRSSFQLNVTETSTSAAAAAEMPERRVFEIVDDDDRLEELGLEANLLNDYESVGILYKEICGDHERQAWYGSPEMVGNTRRALRLVQQNLGAQTRRQRTIADLQSIQSDCRVRRRSRSTIVCRSNSTRTPKCSPISRYSSTSSSSTLHKPPRRRRSRPRQRRRHSTTQTTTRTRKFST